MQKQVIVPVVVAVLGAACALSLRREPEQPGTIKLSGNIELTEVNIAFKTAGRLVELNVVEGAVVQKGQVLARLDRDQLLRQRDREEAGMAVAQSQLAQATTAAEWQRRSLESDLDLRRADLHSAQARLRELESGSRPQEIQEVRAAAEAARSEAERAKKDWDRAQVLYKQDDISTSQYDQFHSRADSTAAALRQAEQRLALVMEGPRKETIEAARSQVERAQAAIQFAEAQRLEITRREQEITARRAETERAKAQAGLVNTQLEDTVATAPVGGVVLVKSSDQGEIVAPGTTILTIGDIEHPWLRGYIGERDLGRVKLGQKVRVTTDSFPGKVYQGRVSFIASEAEFTPKQIQTQEERVKLVYRIKIEIDNPNRELKSNMPADAELEL